MSTDSELIRASANRPAVFGELFERHAASVHRYATSRVGVTAADDVMSETFLIAFQRRSAFDHSRDSAVPWLLGITTNVLHRHRRAETKALKALASLFEATRSPNTVDRRDDVSDVAMALRALSRADRDALLLYAWADLSYEEVSAALEVPIGTVRSRLNRARRLLREATAETEEEEKGYGRNDHAARNA